MLSIQRYVDIVSGVGGGAGVRARDLILRLFTTDVRLAGDALLEASDAAAVGAFFGTTSPEYLRAVFYFGFVNKIIARPKKISFARYHDVAVAPRIYGVAANYALASFTGISSGSFRLTLGSHTADVTGINLSGAASLSAVAALIQTAVRAVTAGGSNWTSATVTYNATARRFELVGGATGAGAVAVTAAGSGTALAGPLGWTTLANYVPGSAAEEPLDAFMRSSLGNNNFGTFAFIPTLTEAQVLAVASYNDTLNVQFAYSVPVTEATAESYYAALSGLSGVFTTISPIATEYPELLPAAVAASTEYARRNSVQNFMFQMATLTPSVTDDATADSLDGWRTNYYGRTQTAGQNLDFYQRGVMMGLATDPVDLNVYYNEMWLKDQAAVTILSLLLSLARVSANATGRSQILAVLHEVIEKATFNGTISIGKPLNTVQKLYITEQTGDPEAWQQVYRIGYWLDCLIESYTTTDGRTEYKATYVLIYSKDDAIRKVDGSHVLI